MPRVAIFFYDLMFIMFKTDLGIILIIQYGLVFTALMVFSGPCMGTEVLIQPQEQAPEQQAETIITEQSKHEAEKAGIEDLLSRMPDVKRQKAQKAYQAGLAKCPEKDKPAFLKTVLDSLRWWKDIEEKDKAEIKKQTRQDDDTTDEDSGGICVDLDKDFLGKIADGHAKNIASAKATLDRMVKKVQKGESLQKVEKKIGKGVDKGSKKKKKTSEKNRDLLEDYGYEAGDEYEEGDSLHEEMEVEYSLDDELDDFRVHGFQQDGDSIDTSNDWEEAKENPWGGKKGIDADDDDALEDQSTDDEE
jgi:hypothetical protein